MYVVGVDGCRGGWISALSDGGRLDLDFHETLSEVVVEYSGAAYIAVDIPIGLAENEPRRCDIEARELLGPRKSSVFPSPDHRVLEAFALESLDYAATSALSRRLTGKGLSRQSYGLMPKIAESDDLISPETQNRVCEIHPELSFMALFGHPMEFSKRKPEGFEERLGLLLDRFPQMEIRSRSDAQSVYRSAGPDDVLDAAAAAASAWRLAHGEAARIPTIPQTDARGLRMEMIY